MFDRAQALKRIESGACACGDCAGRLTEAALSRGGWGFCQVTPVRLEEIQHRWQGVRHYHPLTEPRYSPMTGQTELLADRKRH